MTIQNLGQPLYPSPLSRTTSDDCRVPEALIRRPGESVSDETFELAGPRDRLYFNPLLAKAGIVTCGGLCPGLNNVIRSIFLHLYHIYGVRQILGFRNGYGGLDPATGAPPIELTPAHVESIHRDGGTMLGTSRGPVDMNAAIKNLMRQKVNMLFAIGGDGTQRGAKALADHAREHNYPLAVVGIPKTIDNDVPHVAQSFGFLTAVGVAARALDGAHTEARSVDNGVSLVKLMGRHAGFITAWAAIACQDVNFALIPEAPFDLQGAHGLLAALQDRLRRRRHALIVVAEGAGQHLLGARDETDASGNQKLQDIGPFLRDQIASHFKSQHIEIILRYIDPSYIIRSVPAGPEDAILCDQFARYAVDAAMAGKTTLTIGQMHDQFIHVPMEKVTSRKKSIDLQGDAWQAVLAATGQPSFTA